VVFSDERGPAARSPRAVLALPSRIGAWPASLVILGCAWLGLAAGPVVGPGAPALLPAVYAALAVLGVVLVGQDRGVPVARLVGALLFGGLLGTPVWPTLSDPVTAVLFRTLGLLGAVLAALLAFTCTARLTRVLAGDPTAPGVVAVSSAADCRAVRRGA